jgi:hypothetical protein
MRLNWTNAVAVGLIVVGGASPALAQDFQWRSRLNSGQTVEIKGVNGAISAVASSSGDVEVVATKSARRSNPADVRVEVVPSSRGVTICAVYPDVAGKEPNRCAPGEQGRMNTQNNDTQVNFEVRVPAGINFIGHTVNGEINAVALQGDADVKTVNGSIKVSTSATAVASTVNGSLNVTMGRADFTDDASFKTVNGSITLNIAGGLDAELSAEVLNGSIISDFPITVRGSVTQRRLRGTIGNGGHRLDLSTVNGSIKLLRQ